jgi:TRAP-type C4-dicarboxylate transport system permease small subunit
VKIGKYETPIEGFFAILFTLTLIVLLTLQVFFRFVLNKSISWAEEVSRFAFVWSVYCGVVLAANEDRHIRVKIQLKLFSERTQKWILAVADIFWIIFNSVLAFFAVEFVWSMFEFPYYSQTTGINLVYVYTVIPFGFIFMTVRIIQALVRRFGQEIELKDSRMEL